MRGTRQLEGLQLFEVTRQLEGLQPFEVTRQLEGTPQFPLSVEDLQRIMMEAPYPSSPSVNEDPFIEDAYESYSELEQLPPLAYEIDIGTRLAFSIYFQTREHVNICDRCYNPLNVDNCIRGYEPYDSYNIIVILVFNEKVCEAVEAHRGFINAFVENTEFRAYMNSIFHEVYFRPVLCCRCNRTRNLPTTKENHATIMHEACDSVINRYSQHH